MGGLAERLVLAISADAARFDGDGVNLLLRGLNDVLRVMADQPSGTVRDLLVAVTAGSTSADSVVSNTAPARTDDFAAPESALEKQIAAIWEELLDTERVGRHDNFFDLGGTSLLSLQSVARLEETTGLKLNPTELAFQSLAQVATLCRDAEPARRAKLKPLRALRNLISRRPPAHR